MVNNFYKGANAIIIVFDLTNENSFKNVQNWIDDISKYAFNNEVDGFK